MTCMDRAEAAMLRALPGNDRCIDCDRKSPEWASVRLGIFVCLECSGIHRSLGTHVSFIRSVKMDSWTPDQIATMAAGGGNDACKEFLQHHGINTAASLMGETSVIREKYDTPAGQLYQQVIKARVEGKPEPTELPEPPEIKTNENQNGNGNGNENYTKESYDSMRKSGSGGAVGNPPVKIMEGFGSSPHPSELEDKPDQNRKNLFLGIGAAAVGAFSFVGMALHNNKNRRNGKAGRLSRGV